MTEQVSYLRHSGFFGPEDAQNTTVNIIGVGATGSYIGLTAAKMGFLNFRVWDLDIVESHNLPNQIYDVEHIGQKKVEAFRDVVQRFNPAVKIETHPHFFESDKHKSLLDGIVVMTVDTMSARKDIFESINLNWKVKKVFETRLGFDYGELNVLDPMDPLGLAEWKNTLFNDEDVPDGPCGLRICTTLVSMVSAYTVHSMCGLIASDRNEDEFELRKKTMFNIGAELSTFQIQ